ncbi:TonB-dependent receptor plug domain-containing protein [Flavihumibacter stibioxidans]|uniref:TonB-dependent receptor n=1 Tax=Flavihumibacter stibioxidans TaxID=1834163 RepID=A0ABR7M8S5_9BACT|nr:TonB-dependent receptor [Flavihumibacter stibioxidans]MBC6491434.1 hypothetical protein [Flavihumibacter stibioxidans]
MKRIVVTGLMGLVMWPALAQEDSTARELSEVVITSQRKSSALLKVPYLVETAGSKYISVYQPRTTPEALQGLNGVFVQKTNHGGGSPFVRGLTGNQLLILVDGIRLNNATFRYGPNQYLNTIDAFSIGRMEVAKGTGSVQYGSDALGGVIQVFTKEPEFSVDGNRWSGSAMGKLMSTGMEQTGRGEVQYSGKNMAAMVGVTVRHFGDLVGGDTTGMQSPSGYDEHAWDAKLKFKLSDHTGLTIAHQFLRQSYVPVYHKVVLENFRINETDPQQRMLNYAKLETAGKHAMLRQVSITASWQNSIEGRASIKNNGSTMRRERDEVNTLGLTADIYSVVSKRWTANSGVELYHDRVSSSRNDINELTGSVKSLRGLYPDGAKYGNYSIYSLHHLEWNRFSAELGARLNIFNISLTDTSLGEVSIQPSALVGNAALMYHIDKNHKIFTSVSNGYRAPNVDDMGTLGIVDFRYEVPTASLRPEKSMNAELGYKFQTAKLSGAATFFYMKLNDLITRVRMAGDSINGYPVYRKENTQEGYIWGMEATLAYRPLSGLQVSGNIAYNYGENKTSKEPMRRIPPVHGRVLASYTKSAWHVSGEWLYAGKQDRLAQGDKEDNRIPAGGTPGWKVLNLYAGLQFKSIRLNAGLQNILNEDYRTHGSGINGVGRSVWTNIQFSF